jgi:hypothetical protein
MEKGHRNSVGLTHHSKAARAVLGRQLAAGIVGIMGGEDIAYEEQFFLLHLTVVQGPVHMSGTPSMPYLFEFIIHDSPSHYYN